MEIESIHAAYFSPTHTTRRLVSHLAAALSGILKVECVENDFTLPARRIEAMQGRKGELWVVGLPVYAGRLPNLLLKYLDTWQGHGALALPIVSYGNRSYGNALLELHDLLLHHGFTPMGGAAFVGQHSFACALAAGRPNASDLAVAAGFAADIAGRVQNYLASGELPELHMKGQGAPDYGGYYQPLGEDGKPARFLKAKPETTDDCNACGRCAIVCPMGSIDVEHPSQVIGVCIKCNACIHVCPQKAKIFTDEAYLSHVRFLTGHYMAPAAIELF